METEMLYSRIRSGGVRNEDDPTWTKSLTRNLSLLRGGWTFVNAFPLLRLLEYKSHKNQLELELVGTYRATNCIVTHRITLSNQSNRIDPGSWERRSHRIGGSKFDCEIFINLIRRVWTTYAPGFRNCLELLEHASKRYLRSYLCFLSGLRVVEAEGRGTGNNNSRVNASLGPCSFA